MAELRYKDRTISTKIVYYGPGMSGKTTNIQVLHERAGVARRGELVSVNTAQDRTILFDMLPIKVAAFRGMDLKVQLVAVPGQPMYAATRRLALKDVDSLVFVANSSLGHQQENVASLEEMMANLARLPGDALSLPLVLQYNKRDLPDVVSAEVLDRALNARKTTAIPAVAIRGEGVLETFTAALTLTVTDLARRYKLTDLHGQRVEEWAAAAVEEIFGTRSLASSTRIIAPPQPGAPADEPGRRTVRLTLPPDVSSAEKLDARTNEALVESYAQAAAALGQDAQTIREERDVAQRWLADVLDVLEAVRTVKPGAPRDPVHAVVLGCLAQEVDASHASLIVPAPNQGLRAAALHGLERDPILTGPEPMPRLHSFMQGTSPRWYETEHDKALREILTSSQPSQGSVIAVPLAAGQGAPIGVALLYRPPSAPPPRRDGLKQLADLARILAPFLESAESSGGDPDAGARELLGSASRVAAPRLLQSLRELRQRLADLRRHPDSPVWLTTGLAEIANPLADSVAIARSLTRLDMGALESEPVEWAALLGKFRGDDVQVEIGAGVTTVKLDPVLFSLAVESLIDRARRQGGPDRIVEVRGSVSDGRLSLRIGVKGPVTPPRNVDQGLVFPTKVVELHGGRLSVELSATLGSWVVLEVSAG